MTDDPKSPLPSSPAADSAAEPRWSSSKTTGSVDETIELGRLIGACLEPGDVIALVGRLGAGKTHLSKGLALGLGVSDSRQVNSPTFVLVNEYAGRSAIHHIDAYRLTDPLELGALGFDERIADGAVVIVEWADRVADAMPRRTLWIEIETPDDTTRDFRLRTVDPPLADRLKDFAQSRPSEHGTGS